MLTFGDQAKANDLMEQMAYLQWEIDKAENEIINKKLELRSLNRRLDRVLVSDALVQGVRGEDREQMLPLQPSHLPSVHSSP